MFLYFLSPTNNNFRAQSSNMCKSLGTKISKNSFYSNGCADNDVKPKGTLLWPLLWSVQTLKDPCISSFPSSLKFPCEHQHTASQTSQYSRSSFLTRGGEERQPIHVYFSSFAVADQERLSGITLFKRKHRHNILQIFLYDSKRLQLLE